MVDMKVLAETGVKPDDLARPAAKPKLPRGPAKPLNPLIKSVDDLRPGLVVNGVVTNITQFGAFVNIGLSHEGLVHVSELADHFVNDPNEVVKVNQHVEARVLGVDRARRRISLSLRPEREAPAPRAVEAGVEDRDRDRDDGSKRRGVRLDDIPGRGRRGGGGGGGGGFDRRPPGPGGNATGASRAHALAELEALFKK
ncbi:MAG: S1 RNA-binding domain-containing protein [Myxococcales bacterium]|nr:S1 RNA-binding domain-containing protein [Myxococcales bacterium]